MTEMATYGTNPGTLATVADRDSGIRASDAEREQIAGSFERQTP